MSISRPRKISRRKKIEREIRRAYSARKSTRYYVQLILFISALISLGILNLTGEGIAVGSVYLERSPLFVQHTASGVREQTPLGDIAFGKQPRGYTCGEHVVNGVAYVNGKPVVNNRRYSDNWTEATKGSSECQ